MFRKVLSFVTLLIGLQWLMGCALGAAAQSHTLPTTDGTNSWTGINTYIPGNLRLGSASQTCSGSLVMTGYSNTFVPICGNASGGVSSVNSLVGAITLAAGTNIGLTPSGNTITISSTASNGVTNVNSITGAVTIAAGANITVTPSGNTITIAGTGGGVSSVNALTGAVVFAAGSNITLTPSGNTVTIASTGGAGGTGVTSLNGGTGDLNIVPGTNITVTPSGSNITIAATGTAAGVSSVNSLTGAITLAAGANITLTPSGNTVTIASTGGGGGGSLNTLPNDLLTNTSANTAQDMFNFYATNTYTPQTAISAAAANGGMVTLLPSVAGKVFTNTGNVKVSDMDHQGAYYVPVSAFGAQCDTRTLVVSVSSSSSTVSISGDFFHTYDIGKTLTLVGTVGGVPTAYEPTILSMSGSGPNFTAAVVDTPAPVGFTNILGNLGTDDTAAFNQALIWALAFGGNLTTRTPTVALTIPAGTCQVHALSYNGASIRGLGPTSIIQGMPGEHVFAFPDPSVATHATASFAYIGDFTVDVDGRLDATLPWQIVNASGTTSKTSMYNPAGLFSAASDNPLSPGWFQSTGANQGGAIAGVGAINSGSPTLMTVPAGITLPTATQKIVFPYLTTVFTTTVASVNSGTRVVTLTGSYPGATASQIEWWAGTSPQTIAANISGGSCPASITVTNPNTPAPGYVSNVATFGLIQIDAEQFTYAGRTSAYSGLPSYTFTITGCAQNGTSRVAHTTGATVVPLNQFKPTTPWPITPTINSNATTPTNAAYYPAWNVGASAFWAGVSNGATVGGAGSFTDATITDIWIIGTQLPTNTAGFYLVSLPYNAKFRNITDFNTQYGIMEGVPAFNAGGVWAASQPTADGTSWEGVRLSVCNVFDFVAGGQNSLKDFNTYSQCLNSAGATVGAHTAWYLTYGMNDQTGGALSVPGSWQMINMYHESEFGTDYGRDVQYQLECNNCLWDDMHVGSGGEIHIGGNNQHFRGGNFNNGGNLPIINYGSGNSSDYGTLMVASGVGVGSLYGTNAMIDWGNNSNWVGSTGGFGNGAFGPVSAGVGNGRSPIPTQTNETWNTGNINSMYVSSGGGLILASEFNSSFNWESNAFSIPWFYDTGKLPDGSIAGGAVGCVTSGTFTDNCFAFRFNQNGIYVGPGQRIAAGKYTMYVASRSTGAATQYRIDLGVCSAGSVGTYTIPVSSTYSVASFQVDLTSQGACAGSIKLGVGFSNAADNIYVAYLDFAPVAAQPTDNNLNILNQVLLNGAAGSAGQCLTSNGSGVPDTWGSCSGGGGGGGTVTSVALAVPSWLSVSGSPIAVAGTFTVSSAVIGQNLVLASPTSGSGALAPRALVAGDIPGLAYINALTGDVTASGSGSVASVVNRIGGGTLFNSFSGLVQNTAGVFTQASTFNITGSGQVGTSFAAGVDTMTFSTTPLFNAALGNTHNLVLTNNVSSSSFSNGVDGQTQQFRVCQDATGGRTFVWPTNFAGFPAVTQAASQCTTVTSWYDGANTTVWGDQYNAASCVNNASSNVPCGSATKGYFAVPAGTNSTLVIDTLGVTAGSGFSLTPTPGAGSLLGVTCNATPPPTWGVTTWTAGTSFTVETFGTTSTNPECFSWSLINP